MGEALAGPTALGEQRGGSQLAGAVPRGGWAGPGGHGQACVQWAWGHTATRGPPVTSPVSSGWKEGQAHLLCDLRGPGTWLCDSLVPARERPPVGTGQVPLRTGAWRRHR